MPRLLGRAAAAPPAAVLAAARIEEATARSAREPSAPLGRRRRPAPTLARWRRRRAAGAALRRRAARPGGRRGTSSPLSPSGPLLLLTGGHRSINKVVGLAFEPAGDRARRRRSSSPASPRPSRGSSARPRSCACCERSARTSPACRGCSARDARRPPRGRPGARSTGESLLDALRPDELRGAGDPGHRLLVELARRAAAPARRLAAAPGRRAARAVRAHFGPALEPARVAPRRAPACSTASATCRASASTATARPGTSARRRRATRCCSTGSRPSRAGCPGSTSSTSSPTAPSSSTGRWRPAAPARATRGCSTRRPRTARVAAAAIEEYSAARSASPPRTSRRLRLLCWIVHSRSDYRHLELESPPAPPSAEALRGAVFLGLVEEELARSDELTRPSSRAGAATSRQRLAGERLPEHGEGAVGAVDADPAQAEGVGAGAVAALLGGEGGLVAGRLGGGADGRRRGRRCG